MTDRDITPARLLAGENLDVAQAELERLTELLKAHPAEVSLEAQLEPLRVMCELARSGVYAERSAEALLLGAAAADRLLVCCVAAMVADTLNECLPAGCDLIDIAAAATEEYAPGRLPLRPDQQRQLEGLLAVNGLEMIPVLAAAGGTIAELQRLFEDRYLLALCRVLARWAHDNPQVAVRGLCAARPAGAEHADCLEFADWEGVYRAAVQQPEQSGPGPLPGMLQRRENAARELGEQLRELA